MSNFNVDLMNQLGLTPPGTSAASNSSSASSKISGQLGQSDFLKLMTTQLNNQDPTNPVDNSQLLAQMAQFASVSSLQDMQTSMQKLLTSNVSNQTMQAASLVGHQVVAAGSNAVLNSGGQLMGAVDVSQKTNDLMVGIYDSSGQLVKTMNLGAQGQGMVPISWDGVTDTGTNAPAGIYQIKALANDNGSTQALGTYVASNISSVTVDSTNQQIMLNTSTGDSIKLSDVKQIM